MGIRIKYTIVFIIFTHFVNAQDISFVLSDVQYQLHTEWISKKTLMIHYKITNHNKRIVWIPNARGLWSVTNHIQISLGCYAIAATGLSSEVSVIPLIRLNPGDSMSYDYRDYMDSDDSISETFISADFLIDDNKLSKKYGQTIDISRNEYFDRWIYFTIRDINLLPWIEKSK